MIGPHTKLTLTIRDTQVNKQLMFMSFSGLCDESGFEVGSSEETKLQAIKRIDVVRDGNFEGTPLIFILCGDTADRKVGTLI